MTRAQRHLRSSLFILIVIAPIRLAHTQSPNPPSEAPPPNTPLYNLNVAVDEVSLTFHASDTHGLPINDLTVSELQLLDNGRPPRRILTFQSLNNIPIRAAILMDTSISMLPTRALDRAIATRYVERLLRQQSDQALVINFELRPHLAQSWTNQPATLTTAIRNHVSSTPASNRLRGTALYDAVYETCQSYFGHIDNTASGNFVLIFTDGEDNASRTTLRQTIDMCQHTNTAIYAFHPAPGMAASSGTETLNQLATQSGGRVFYDDSTDTIIDQNLRTVEADLRNLYRITYRPPTLKHNGAFHQIELHPPDRVDRIFVRSGYYAPTH